MNTLPADRAKIVRKHGIIVNHIFGRQPNIFLIIKNESYIEKLFCGNSFFSLPFIYSSTYKNINTKTFFFQLNPTHDDVSYEISLIM